MLEVCRLTEVFVSFEPNKEGKLGHLVVARRGNLVFRFFVDCLEGLVRVLVRHIDCLLSRLDKVYALVLELQRALVMQIGLRAVVLIASVLRYLGQLYRKFGNLRGIYCVLQGLDQELCTDPARRLFYNRRLRIISADIASLVLVII